MFIHKSFIDIPKLETKIIEHERFYVTPEGVLCPSVTTILADFESEGLTKWRAEVGEKMADYISFQASASGSEFHKIIEDYLNNNLDETKYKRLLPKAHFHNVKHLLDRIDNITAQEAHLYSNTLRLAGRTDCIAEFDKVVSIIDFKTAKKEKKEEWNKKYFLQETAYALMTRELGIEDCFQIVTIISCEDGASQLLIKNREDYIDELRTIVERYHTESLNI